MPITILVTGGRDYGALSKPYYDIEEQTRVAARQVDALFATLDALHSGPRGPIVLLRHGGAYGADTVAALWARKRDVPTDTMPADWGTHGAAAGPIRNTAMVAKTAAEPGDKAVVAATGGRGTADCVRKARASGLEIIEVKP